MVVFDLLGELKMNNSFTYKDDYEFTYQGYEFRELLKKNESELKNIQKRIYKNRSTRDANEKEFFELQKFIDKTILEFNRTEKHIQSWLRYQPHDRAIPLPRSSSGFPNTFTTIRSLKLEERIQAIKQELAKLKNQIEKNNDILTRTRQQRDEAVKTLDECYGGIIETLDYIKGLEDENSNS